MNRTPALVAALALLAAPVSARPPQVPTITLFYTTAETSTSALVAWNTDIASDSRVQYSTQNPIPPGAPTLYLAANVTYHEFELTGLAPATNYFYKVTSCARHGCGSATGRFDTFPTCPDEVPAIAGVWERVPSPNVGGTPMLRNELLGVAAISENEAWTVGWSQEPNAPPYIKRTLIQHFDGAAWTIVPSPNPAGDTQTVLYSVSGTSANDVWAVGSTHNGLLPSRTLILHWDGTQWTIVPSPSPDTQLNELRAVAAVADDDVWAVGYRGGTQSPTPLETLVLRWNGTSWIQVATPNVPVGANQLWALAALSASDVWAVGSAGGGPLAMHFDGTGWNVLPVDRNRGMVSERLTGVSGVPTQVTGARNKSVWAVGEGRGFVSNRVSATIKQWKGGYWTEKVCRARSASNPPPGYEGGGPDFYFTGVSAFGANDLWGVGASGSGPFIQHRDDEAWTTVTHPRAFPNAAVLRAVATTPGGGAWAVGLEIIVYPDGSASPERTLIHRYIP